MDDSFSRFGIQPVFISGVNDDLPVHFPDQKCSNQCIEEIHPEAEAMLLVHVVIENDIGDERYQRYAYDAVPPVIQLFHTFYIV